MVGVIRVSSKAPMSSAPRVPRATPRSSVASVVSPVLNAELDRSMECVGGAGKAGTGVLGTLASSGRNPGSVVIGLPVIVPPPRVAELTTMLGPLTVTVLTTRLLEPLATVVGRSEITSATFAPNLEDGVFDKIELTRLTCAAA